MPTEARHSEIKEGWQGTEGCRRLDKIESEVGGDRKQKQKDRRETGKKTQNGREREYGRRGERERGQG